MRDASAENRSLECCLPPRVSTILTSRRPYILVTTSATMRQRRQRVCASSWCQTTLGSLRLSTSFHKTSPAAILAAELRGIGAGHRGCFFGSRSGHRRFKFYAPFILAAEPRGVLSLSNKY